MHFHLVTKIESVGGVVTTSLLGWTADETKTSLCESSGAREYANWLNTNSDDITNGVIDADEWLAINGPVYCANWTTDGLGKDHGIPEVTDWSFLEV
jgi:hypothetical protein